MSANLLHLLKETFEGRAPGEGGMYLESGSGLLQTLDRISADTASLAPSPGAPTIAGHAAHLGYYSRVVHAAIRGRDVATDWPASWSRTTVDAAAWTALRDELRQEYRALRATVDSLTSWEPGQVGDAMAIVAHTAFHLGAIRQILRWLGER